MQVDSISDSFDHVPAEEVSSPAANSAESGAPTLLFSSSPAPPLRLTHLMLLTTVVAGLAGLLKAFPLPGEAEGVSGAQVAVTSAIRVVQTMLVGVGLTITLLGISWRRAGLAYFDQPGHVILLSYAVSTVYYLAAVFTYLSLDIHYHYMVAWMIFALLIPVHAIIDGYGARRVADTTLWKTYFWLGMVVSLLSWSAVSRWWIVMVGMLGLLLLCVVGDLRTRRQRHWTHWLGCMLPVANYVTYGCYLLAWQAGFFDSPA